MSEERDRRGKIEPTSACRKSGSNSAYHQQQEQQHQQHREESVSPGRLLSTMTCLRSTRPRGFASRRYYIHYLFIPGKETATKLEMFSSSRTVRLVVRESEEMEVRVMWKSDSNETRYNGRSAQGLNSQEKIWLSFIHGNSRQHGIWTALGEEKRNMKRWS